MQVFPDRAVEKQMAFICRTCAFTHVKVLVTGASGFVGHELLEQLECEKFAIYPVFRDHSIIHDNAQYCDLRDYGETEILLTTVDPNAIIHCAASSSIEECEKNKIESWENNVMGTMNLLRLMKTDVHFVYLSTAQVFDGNDGLYDEESVRNPINWYGKTKVASEDIVSNMSSLYTIVRLSYQYGCDVKGKNFVHKAFEKLTTNEPVSADDDIISSPTYIGTTVSSLQEIITDGITGVYNIADKEPISKYRLLLNLANELNRSSLVTKERLPSMLLASRPKNTSLDVSKFSHTFNVTKPLNQKEALQRLCKDFEERRSQ